MGETEIRGKTLRCPRQEIVRATLVNVEAAVAIHGDEQSSRDFPLSNGRIISEAKDLSVVERSDAAGRPKRSVEVTILE
jgi:hypothetical protein